MGTMKNIIRPMLALLLCFCLFSNALSQEKNVNQLIQDLQDKRNIVRREAADALTNMGKPAIQHLFPLLKSENSDIRQRAAYILGSIREPIAIDPLICALEDPAYLVRAEAGRALSKIGASAVEPLIAVLQNNNSHGRGSAAAALGRIKDERAVGPLVTALKDRDSELRSQAATALSNIGRPAVDPLLAALQSGEGELRTMAADSLGKIRDPRAAGPLIAALKDEDRKFRKRAARALRQFDDDPRTVESLITALKDKDLAVIAGAYGFYLRRAFPSTKDILIEALNSFGDASMADDLLNCGNKKLEGAARVWASNHGYKIMPFHGSRDPLRWGNR